MGSYCLKDINKGAYPDTHYTQWVWTEKQVFFKGTNIYIATKYGFYVHNKNLNKMLSLQKLRIPTCIP